MTYEVSVVMGVYNGAAELQKTIQSVLAQQGVGFEFVIVDDGSTDESPEILDSFSKSDKRVRILRQENRGLTEALIHGCSEASGKFIARQDVGDISLPSRLVKQISAFRQDTQLSFVSCWTEFCGPEWEPLYISKGSGAASTPQMIISLAENHGVKDGPSCHPSVMFLADHYRKVGGYRSEFRFGQDWDLWFRLAESGKFQMIQESLYKVRVFPSGISMKNFQAQSTIGELSLSALKMRLSGMPETEILRKAKELTSIKKEEKSSLSAGYYFVAECLRRNGDARSRKYFLQSLSENPFYLKSWIRLFQAMICCS